MRILNSCLLISLFATLLANSPLEGATPQRRPESLKGWSSETFALPPSFAPKLPKGTESLLFAPGWRKPGDAGFWSYAFVMWIEEASPSMSRIDNLLEDYYNGLLTSFAQAEGKDISRSPVRMVVSKRSAGKVEAQMRAIDAFATFKPITVRFEINVVSLGPKRSALRVKLSPQSKEHPIWKSLKVAVDDILDRSKSLEAVSPPISVPLEERRLVEMKIREHLRLPATTTLKASDFARVKELNFSQQPLTDAGLVWLASSNAGLNALTSLNLQGTKVTDIGIEALASKGTALKRLETLLLASTNVTDAGLRSISRPDSGLKNLTSLDFRSTSVTDAGVSALARADTAASNLTTLDLSFTKVSDEGIKNLSRPETGVKKLMTLGLASTGVTDGSLKSLAHPTSGLKALKTLNLAFSRVTDVGVKSAASPQSALRSLDALFLYGTRLTDAGVKDIANPNTGLKRLTTLDIGETAVTDLGLKEFARVTSGLRRLSKLHLRNTKVTDVGAKAVKARWPKIELFR